jgi:pyruvate/oxaloacetate carboxyltransferase
MIAALRQPVSSSVTALRSGVMKRAVPGSDSIRVFDAMSDERQGRRMSRSVSMMGP